LPAPFPNLLVNGSAGIAVGMATNVPPHNLGEVIDACVWLIENIYLPGSSAAEGGSAGAPTDAGAEGDRADSGEGGTGAVLSRGEKLKQLIRMVPGPDFPTAGYIVGRSGIVQAYTTGRGSIQMRARSMIETSRKGDKLSIIVTEIPYQVN